MADSYIARLLILAAILCTPVHAAARPEHPWQLDELAKAPALVVGRILAVQKGGLTRDKAFWWSSESRDMNADIRVLRAHTASGAPLPFDTIKVHFLGCNEGSTSAEPGPLLPEIKPGEVQVLPLRENKNPASQPWELLAEEGPGLTIPAREDMLFSESPTTARGFLLREIANVLARGTPEEVTAVGRYLSNQFLDLTPGLMAYMEPAIGDDRKRWAEIAGSILATTGVPRPSTKELFSDKDVPEKRDWQRGFLIARAALRKLGPSPETDDLLIKTLIEDAPLHAWGSATTLLEFADNPVANETLRRALQDDLPGSSYIAWTFAHAGHQGALKEGLVRALKVADRPTTDYTELQGAAMLLRDFGSDQQLDQLAGLVRKYQTQDRRFYNLLWQWGTESDNPRAARVLAVVLRDQQIAFDETRVCDFALGVLERATGQRFGSGGKTLAERDAAVARALAWIKSQGISD
jgi:hypothetical protein